VAHGIEEGEPREVRGLNRARRRPQRRRKQPRVVQLLQPHAPVLDSGVLNVLSWADARCGFVGSWWRRVRSVPMTLKNRLSDEVDLIFGQGYIRRTPSRSHGLSHRLHR
jgi:hypothetical protein